MARGIIYLIINKQNGYKYVGQTTQGMNKEWKQHIQDSLRMSLEPLHYAMRRYGNHNFTIKEIDECDESLLDDKEKYWIKHYNTLENQKGYNTKTKKKTITTEKVIKTKVEPWNELTNQTRGNGKHSGLLIRGKNLETGICTDYENARIAALSITGNANRNSNILLAAKKGGTAYGHKWEILEEKSKKKSVFSVYKKTGEFGSQYESIAEAIRLVGDSGRGAGLIKSLRNPGRYSWKGYYWFFVSGNSLRTFK